MSCNNSIVKIGDICTFKKGLSVPRDRTCIDNKVPYLHYGDVYKKYDTYVDINSELDTIIKISDTERIGQEQYLHEGDIVYNLTSETVEELGKAVLIKNLNDIPFVAGMETTIMKVNNRNVLDPYFLNYMIQSDYFKQTLRQYVTGMKVYRVHPRDISRISIKIPQLEVQKKIVLIIDNINDVINNNKKINDYLAA